VSAPDGAATYEVLKVFWYPAGRRDTVGRHPPQGDGLGSPDRGL